MAADEWVEATRNGACVCVGRVKSPQLFANGRATVDVSERCSSNTLTPTGTTYTYHPPSTDTLKRATCHCRDGTWFYYGPLGGGRGEACSSSVTGAETLSPSHAKTLCNATAHDFYSILTSQKFKPPTALSDGGLWHRRGLMDVAGPTDAEQRIEMKRILARGQSADGYHASNSRLYTWWQPMRYRLDTASASIDVQPAARPLTLSMSSSTAPQR